MATSPAAYTQETLVRPNRSTTIPRSQRIPASLREMVGRNYTDADDGCAAR